MNALLRFLAAMALGAAALAVALALIVYSGAYDVSATSGHTTLVEKTLGTLVVRSVRAHARDIVSPVAMDFRDPAVLEKGAGHFEAMCRTCHGAPGRKADPWLLYPPPPDLADAIRDRPWTDAEVFWIIKHGIKDTAMGAFGGSHPGAHSDEEIWGITALVRQFSTLPPEHYQAMVDRANAAHDAASAHQPTGREQRPATEQKSNPPASPHSHKH